MSNSDNGNKPKLTKSEKLFEQAKLEDARIKEIQRRKNEIIAKAKAEERKERAHRLIQFGGLVEIAFPDGIDKGLLLGFLMSASKITDQEQLAGHKRNGDYLLHEREAARKVKRTNEGKE